MSTTISTSDLETAAVTFLGTFLTNVAIFGGGYTGSAELAGIAAVGVLGYHYAAGNITVASTASAAPAK